MECDSLTDGETDRLTDGRTDRTAAVTLYRALEQHHAGETENDKTFSIHNNRFNEYVYRTPSLRNSSSRIYNLLTQRQQ